MGAEWAQNERKMSACVPARLRTSSSWSVVTARTAASSGACGPGMAPSRRAVRSAQAAAWRRERRGETGSEVRACVQAEHRARAASARQRAATATQQRQRLAGEVGRRARLRESRERSGERAANSVRDAVETQDAHLRH
jgi:hypothetical protein